MATVNFLATEDEDLSNVDNWYEEDAVTPLGRLPNAADYAIIVDNISSGTLTCGGGEFTNIVNGGTINSSTPMGGANATFTAGTFNCAINIAPATFNGGTFNGAIIMSGGCFIQGGTFNSTVTTSGVGNSIDGGTFNGLVTLPAADATTLINGNFKRGIQFDSSRTYGVDDRAAVTNIIDGVSNCGQTGTYVEVSESNVKSGITYGAASALTGTYTASQHPTADYALTYTLS